MSTIKIKAMNDKNTWEQFALSSKQGNFLQSWNWGEFNHSLGHKIFRLGFYQNNQLKGVALLIKKIAKRGIYLECPAGPLIPWHQPQYFSIFINQIKILAKKETAVFIRIRPNILSTPQNFNLFKQKGLIKAPMHLHAQTTWVLDITPSEEDLLKNMRKNTRYSIKKAQKLGVKIIQSLNIKDVDLLYQLQLETIKRHKFVPFSQEYFTKQFQAFSADHQIQLFKAIYKHKILAISFIIFYGKEAVYHYSGSSNQMRHIPASYLLQWQAIKTAKKRKINQYNFWGISKINNPRHRFSGVTLFKTGFGGKQIDYLPAHDLPLKLTYWPTVYLFESLRRYFRRL